MKLYFRLLWCAALAFLAACSCSTEAALDKIIGMNISAPVFYGCKARSGGIEFYFSVPVTVVSAYFDPPLTVESQTEGKTVAIGFSDPLPGGSRVVADLLVEDATRNTLNILVPFRTRNDRVPALVINELRTEHSTLSAANLRLEFVELKILKSGNLGALRLFMAGSSSNGLTEPVMEFPPVEVAAGEYVVIHLRTLEEGCVDETGSDRTASGGNEASPARDFWIPGSKKLIHKTDAVFFLDQDDFVVEGVLLCENPANPWSKALVPAVELLGRQGAWTGGPVPDPAEAVSTAAVGGSYTKSISRDETRPDSNGAADWYVTAASGATPGRANSPRP